MLFDFWFETEQAVGSTLAMSSCKDKDTLISAGSILLNDNTAAKVVQYIFNNAKWTSVQVGAGSDIPGPNSAIEVKKQHVR